MSDCVCTTAASGLCPVPFLNNLDVCDLELYKHPPFMWTLWYISLFGKFVYDKVKEMLDKEGGDDGHGGDDGKKKEEKKDEPVEEPEPAAEEEEEPPAEEEA